MERRCDILIVGGGLAGMSLSACLGTAGMDVILADRAPLPQRLDPQFDGRATALALASARLLRGAGVWPALEPVAAPLLDIRIGDGPRPGLLHYDHRLLGDQPFGWNVENRHLRHALASRIAALKCVTALAPAEITAIEPGPEAITARLKAGGAIRARLLVAADGRHSTLRDLAGIGTRGWEYDQQALAFTARIAAHHGHVAVEHFRAEGPFAWLPLPDAPDGAPRVSVIWSLPPARAEALMALDLPEFEAEFSAMLGPALAPARLEGKRWRFPLSLTHAKSYTAPRLALLADAAHAMHPVAGQGLNMGLRDVAALAELVVDRARLGLDPGAPDLLAAYGRWRRADNVAMMAGTDGIVRLFSNANPVLRLCRDLGLSAVQALPPVKRRFMRQAMGLGGDMPRLLRGEAL